MCVCASYVCVMCLVVCVYSYVSCLPRFTTPQPVMCSLSSAPCINPHYLIALRLPYEFELSLLKLVLFLDSNLTKINNQLLYILSLSLYSFFLSLSLSTCLSCCLSTLLYTILYCEHSTQTIQLLNSSQVLWAPASLR